MVYIQSDREAKWTSYILTEQHLHGWVILNRDTNSLHWDPEYKGLIVEGWLTGLVMVRQRGLMDMFYCDRGFTAIDN